jgi:hypothetical protein
MDRQAMIDFDIDEFDEAYESFMSSVDHTRNSVDDFSADVDAGWDVDEDLPEDYEPGRVILSIRRNRRSFHTIIIKLPDYYSAHNIHQLASALKRNSYIEHIYFKLGQYPPPPRLLGFLKPLLGTLKTLPTLRVVTLADSYDELDRTGAVESLLRAVSRNANVHTLVLNKVRVPVESLASVLQNSQSIVKYCLIQCEFTTSDANGVEAVAAQLLADAFGSNSLICEVRLDISQLESTEQEQEPIQVTYLEPIIRRLQSHTTLKRLIFSNSDVRALQFLGVLVQERTLPIVGFTSLSGGEELLQPIAASVISGAVTRLLISNCSFLDDTRAAFESLFRPASNLTEIWVDCDQMYVDDRPLSEIFGSMLFLGNSNLRQLTVRCVKCPWLKVVAAITEAIATNASLEHARIDYSGNQEVHQKLIRGIPKWKGLKSFQLRNFGEVFDTNDLLDALKRNGSIISFDGSFISFDGQNENDGDIFDDEEEAKVRFYAERNKHLPKIGDFDSPSTIPLGLWPTIISIANECEYGNTTTFNILRNLAAVLENLVTTDSADDSDHVKRRDRDWPSVVSTAKKAGLKKGVSQHF